MGLITETTRGGTYRGEVTRENDLQVAERLTGLLTGLVTLQHGHLTEVKRNVDSALLAVTKRIKEREEDDVRCLDPQFDDEEGIQWHS